MSPRCGLGIERVRFPRTMKACFPRRKGPRNPPCGGHAPDCCGKSGRTAASGCQLIADRQIVAVDHWKVEVAMNPEKNPVLQRAAQLGSTFFECGPRSVHAWAAFDLAVEASVGGQDFVSCLSSCSGEVVVQHGRLYWQRFAGVRPASFIDLSKHAPAHRSVASKP